MENEEAGAAAVSVPKATLIDRARKFSKRWESASSEKSESQQFWIDFFSMFDRPAQTYGKFEAFAHRPSTGGSGYIDLFDPAKLAIEQKSRGEDLDLAWTQLFDYIDGLTNERDVPWLLIVCDFEKLEWRNWRENTRGSFIIANLADNLDQFYWLAGHKEPGASFGSDEDLNLHATQLLTNIHDHLAEKRLFAGHDLRVWMVRILFCLFADDTLVWDRDLFRWFIFEHTREDGTDLGAQLQELFQWLDTPADRRPRNPKFDGFSYINGSIFREQIKVPHCDTKVRHALLTACGFNWAQISPAIFGSMFQNVMDPEERRNLGAHYTSERDIRLYAFGWGAVCGSVLIGGVHQMW